MEITLKNAEPGTIVDALQILKLPYFVRGGFNYASQINSIIKGKVRTIRIELATDDSEITKNPNKPLQELIISGCENQILVIESNSFDFAYLGEITSNILKAANLSGVVIMGSTRDFVGIMNSGLPVYADGLTPSDVSSRKLKLTLDVPLEINNFQISTSCYGVASIDGLVIFQQEDLNSITSQVNLMLNSEFQMLKTLKNNRHKESLSALLDRHNAVNNE